MRIGDKANATAKTMAERAREQARHGFGVGRARLDEARARRRFGRLLRKLGEVCYAEHRGDGDREAVVRALGALDAHAQGRPSTAADTTQVARRARDIMHPGAECINETDSLAIAAQKMRDLGVGSLPICGEDDRLHGIITDRDIVVRCIAEGRDPAQVRASELAGGTLYWVDATADVDHVLREMEEHRVKRLPVIEDHRLIGVISEADLARNLSEHRLAEFVEKVYGTS
jgi:CBS domain-containing protein